METSAYVGLVTYSLWQVIILRWPGSRCSGLENCAVYKICFSSHFASLLAPDLYSAEDYCILFKDSRCRQSETFMCYRSFLFLLSQFSGKFLRRADILEILPQHVDVSLRGLPLSRKKMKGKTSHFCFSFEHRNFQRYQFDSCYVVIQKL